MFAAFAFKNRPFVTRKYLYSYKWQAKRFDKVQMDRTRQPTDPPELFLIDPVLIDE